MRRSLVFAIVIGSASVLVPTGPASASCAVLPPIEEAYRDNEVVFKGTVLEFSNNTASVTVDEVWKGPPLSGEVTVITGAVDDDPDDNSGVASSVDRSVEEGVTYLFFPVNSKDPFRDNICTATTEYEPGLERLREPSLGESEASPGEGAPGVLPRTGIDRPLMAWLLAAWAIMGLGTAVLLRSRNRSRPPS